MFVARTWSMTACARVGTRVLVSLGAALAVALVGAVACTPDVESDTTVGMSGAQTSDDQVPPAFGTGLFRLTDDGGTPTTGDAGARPGSDMGEPNGDPGGGSGGGGDPTGYNPTPRSVRMASLSF